MAVFDQKRPKTAENEQKQPKIGPKLTYDGLGRGSVGLAGGARWLGSKATKLSRAAKSTPNRGNDTKVKTCNLCGHLQRCQMRDIERVPVKQPKKQPEKLRNTQKTVKTAVFSGVFQVFFRLFFGRLTGTPRDLLRLFSMSGIWHLCRWPQRLQ